MQRGGKQAERHGTWTVDEWTSEKRSCAYLNVFFSTPSVQNMHLAAGSNSPRSTERLDALVAHRGMGERATSGREGDAGSGTPGQTILAHASPASRPGAQPPHGARVREGDGDDGPVSQPGRFRNRGGSVLSAPEGPQSPRACTAAAASSPARAGLAISQLGRAAPRARCAIVGTLLAAPGQARVGVGAATIRPEARSSARGDQCRYGSPSLALVGAALAVRDPEQADIALSLSLSQVPVC